MINCDFGKIIEKSFDIKVVIDNKGTMVNLDKLIPFPY